MLWDIIRDWFVQYVWGGTTSSNTTFGSLIGHTFNVNGSNVLSGNSYTDTLCVPIGNFWEDSEAYVVNYLTLGDWLSTTSTIIVLVLLCAFLFLVVRYLFRLTSGLIRGH